MTRRLLLLGVWIGLNATSGLGQEIPPRYVEWLGYLGGSGEDIGYGVGTDAAGNVYVAGSTSSTDFGALAGWSEPVEIDGATDGFVAKLSPDGSELLAVASIGGPGADAALALRVAPDGSVIVGGNVGFGFSSAEHDCAREVAGANDAFVARFGAELDLLALQLVGGGGDEGLRDLHVAPDGSIAIVGFTTSTDLLRGWVGTPLQSSFAGGANDFFVARLRLDAAVSCAERLLYQSYLGSAGNEVESAGSPFPGSVRARRDGLLTVSGITTSVPTFIPRKPGGYEAPGRGQDETFVVQLRGEKTLPASQQLLYSAFLGGSSFDRSNWLEVDASGKVIVVGQTSSGNYPSTDGSTFNGWNDNFITVLDPSRPAAEQLRSSGMAGGEHWDISTDGVLRTIGTGGKTIVVGGSTGSAQFPSTADRLGDFNGSEIPQAYLYEWRLDEGLPRSERIVFASPLTAATDCFDRLRCNRVIALAESTSGSVIACGAVSGALLHVVGGPALAEKSAGADVLIGSFDLRRPVAKIGVEPGPDRAPAERCFDAAGSSTPEGTRWVSYAWDFGPGGKAEGARPCHRFDRAGVYPVQLTVENDLGLKATASQTLTIGCPAADITPWTASDIGAVQFPGSAARLAPDVFGVDGTINTDLRVCAAGRTLSGAADALHFVQQAVEGDQRLELSIDDFDAPSGSATAAVGLMMRESLDPKALYVGILLRGGTSGSWYSFGRIGEDGPSRSSRIDSASAFRSVSLDRVGDAFIAGVWRPGPRGEVWSEVGRTEIPDLGVVYAGLAATAGASATAAFQSIEVSRCGLSLTPLSPPGIGPFIRGDCNGDGGTSGVVDALLMLTAKFIGGVEIPCAAACDADSDGATSGLLDALFLLTANFLGGVEISAPHPGCGWSEAAGDDRLACAKPLSDCP